MPLPSNVVLFRVPLPVNRLLCCKGLFYRNGKRDQSGGQRTTPVGAAKSVRVVSQAGADSDYLANVDEVVGCDAHQGVAQSQACFAEKLYGVVIRDDLVNGRLRVKIQACLMSNLVGGCEDARPVAPFSCTTYVEVASTESPRARPKAHDGR